jgi:GH24 family phage-related lysozyme (muramidase)
MNIEVESIPECGIDLIKRFEGYHQELADGRAKAYPDPLHGWEVPTIGFGTTKYPDGSKVKEGDIITRAEAEKHLIWEVEKVCKAALEKIPTWKQMNSNQRGALYSFAYNLGANFYGGDRFESITKVCDDVSRWGDKQWVTEQFEKYRNPGTPVEEGLRRRRRAEAELFCTPLNNNGGNQMSSQYFLVFSQHFDRDPGLDCGRLSLNHLEKGTIDIWIVTSATEGKQYSESFHEKGGLIPPQYRCDPKLKNWVVKTDPLYLPQPGIEGNFYKIDPHEVTTDKGGVRGDFGIHKDANVPGSLGCIVMSSDRFNSFEKHMTQLRAEGVTEVPLFVQYS